MTSNEQPETEYHDVGEFVHNYLTGLYQRQVTDINDTVWCPEWWRHKEAVARLEAVWRAFEFYRQDPTTGMSIWLLNHADKHMAVLFDPKGPFKYCSVRHGHKEMLTRLPVATYPEGLFSNPEECSRTT